MILQNEIYTMWQFLPIDVVVLVLYFLPYEDLKGIGKISRSFRAALQRRDFWSRKALQDYSINESHFRNQYEYNDRYRYLTCRSSTIIAETRRDIDALDERMSWLGPTNIDIDLEYRALAYTRNRLWEKMMAFDAREYRRERFPKRDNVIPTYHRRRDYTDTFVREMSLLTLPISLGDFASVVLYVIPNMIVDIGVDNNYLVDDDQVYRFSHCLPSVIQLLLRTFGVRTQLDLRDLYGMSDDHGITHIQTEDGEFRLTFDDSEYQQRKSGYYHVD